MYVLCAVYDSQADVFMRPFFARSLPDAERSFGDAVRHPDSDYGKHPHDYSLFRVAQWDDVTGVVVGDKAPLHICNAVAMFPADHPNLQNVSRVVPNPVADGERAAFVRRTGLEV